MAGRVCRHCAVGVEDRRQEFYEFGFLVYCSPACLLADHPWLSGVERFRVAARRREPWEPGGEGR